MLNRETSHSAIDSHRDADSEHGNEESARLDSGRPHKRPRLRISSPAAPPNQIKGPTIRLRLPARGKGKEREQVPEEPQKGMFDDFLSLSDRDIAFTTITEADKLRVERSRLALEVRIPLVSVLLFGSMNRSQEKAAAQPLSAVSEDTPVAGPSSRPLRSHHNIPSIPPSSMPTPGMSASPAPVAAAIDRHRLYRS